MKLNQIKDMFVVGDEWDVTRQTDKSANLIGKNDGTKRRKVLAKNTVGLQWEMPDGRTMYMDWPKMKDVTTAQMGILEFAYAGSPTTITCTKV
jgi:hypothetical protein